MDFNSVPYLLFIPVLFFCLYLAGEKLRWLVLLGASYYFYLCLKHIYLPLSLVLVTVGTYGCALLLRRCGSEAGKQALFWAGVCGNLLVLAAVKYLPFLERSLNAALGFLAPHLSVPQGAALVSIGVSYFVFQALSYLIDVYLEIEEPERHLGYFALYLAFFPKLLQGPIERAADLMPQLRSGAPFDHQNFRAGALQFAWGLFKKAVVADRLALYVNTVYGNVHGFSGLPLVIATYLYAFQLYYDFSGYTDMALGTARMLNIRLTQNFNAPYLATSIADFWRRWHITFSRWILDYLFKPLQMQLRNWRNLGTALALLVTFLASGIWHGASWCFIIWGGLHGIYLGASVFYRPLQKKIYRALGLEKSPVQRLWQTVITFQLVCFAWIFFRAASVPDALYVVTHLLDGATGTGSLLAAHGSSELTIAAASMLVIWLVALARERTAVGQGFYQAPGWLRLGAYLCLAAVLLLFNKDSNAGFIYFNF